MSKKEDKKTKALIVNTLKDKAFVKQKVFDNTLSAFKQIKIALNELSQEYSGSVSQPNSKINIEYVDKGDFESNLVFSSETLIFNFQPNIFEFDKSHSVWTTSYLQDNPLNAFVGIINVYNFLSDSYNLNRSEDLGYLIARVFINREMHYFVEGKRQLGFLYNDFANSKVNQTELKKIIESAILYCLDFELLVPNYDDVSIVSVEQMKDKISKSKVQTGKRLGFQFYHDDVNI